MSSLDLSVLSDNTNLQFAAEDPSAGMAGSFQTQMAMAMMKDSRLRVGAGLEGADQDRMGRLILARMKTLEEGFADIIKEMRDLKTSSTASPTARNSSTDELKTYSAMESAGRNRLRRAKGTLTPGRTVYKRPVSQRSMGPRTGFAGMQDTKGKGKQVDYSTDEEAAAEDSFTKRGSSF
jgi:hypothetical protein